MLSSWLTFFVRVHPGEKVLPAAVNEQCPFRATLFLVAVEGGLPAVIRFGRLYNSINAGASRLSF
jgi:hypothetical protein